MCHADPHGFERVDNDISLRGSNNVVFLAHKNDNETDDEHAQSQKVGSPEIDVQLHLSRGDCRKRADIDAKVEDHVDSLNSGSRIHNHSLA